VEVERLKTGVKRVRKMNKRFKHEHIHNYHSMKAANGVHLSFCPRPIVPGHLGRLGQPKNVADAGSSPEREPDDSRTPSFVSIEVNLQCKRASTAIFASYVRFPPPPRAIESAIDRAPRNARATAVRF